MGRWAAGVSASAERSTGGESAKAADSTSGQDAGSHAFKPTEAGRCPFLHGTVYSDPFPKYKHGAQPAICQNGCEPVASASLDETWQQRLRREAVEMCEKHGAESGATAEAISTRQQQVLDSINKTGTYEHTVDELQWGIRVAWRNAAKCANRKFWDEIVLLDHRHAETPAEMFEGCKQLMELASKNRAAIPYLSCFKPRTPGTTNGPRIWNSQLVRFACYEQPDGSLLGDPANKDLTDHLLRETDWEPPEPRGMYDVLPLLLQIDPDEEPQRFEFPPWYVGTVSLKHSEEPWLAAMNLKWCSIPIVSAMELWLGGLCYTACPFSGWFADTEVVRDLCDEERYNLVRPIAERWGLNTRSDATLWKDKVVALVNEAVMQSFRAAGWGIVDHHTMLKGFYEWYNKEKALRGYCPGNWKWVVPPINGFLSPCYMKLNKMTEYTVLPQYVYAPGFKAHAKRLRAHRLGANRSAESEARVQACRRLFMNPYLVRFLGLARRIARRLRPPLVIAFATVTGNTRNYALRLANLLASSFAVELMNVEEYSSESLKRAAAVVQLTSTYGSGAPPTAARKWLTYLTTTEAKQALEGKPWATLGFGSTQYPRFCAAADLFAQVAAEAGVRSLLRIGKCDAEGNEEANFRAWVSALLYALRDAGLLFVSRCAALNSQISVSNAEAKVGPPVFNVVPMPGLKHTKEDISRFSAPVKSVTQLLSGASAARSTVRVVIDLSDLPYLQYCPGDHLVAYAANDAEVVADVAAHIGVNSENLDDPFFLEALAPDLNPAPFPTPTTWRTALANYMDLNAAPSPLALQAFAEALHGDAAAAATAEHLRTLARDSMAYQEWLITARPRWRDVWRMFPALSGRVPAARIFELCTLAAPRYYSISSSLAESPGEVAVTVSQLSYTLPDGRTYQGFASSFLNSCVPGDAVHFAFVAAPAFHMPMHPECPSVWVAAGTGIAPFRSFWRERMARRKYVEKLAPALLIFGCRTLEQDSLYKQELDEAVAAGALTDVVWCLSREPGTPKMYVQDGIVANRDAIAGILQHPDAHYHVCGAADMSSTVAGAVQEILGAELTIRMQSEGRWHEDIFGAKKAESKTAAEVSHDRDSKLTAMQDDTKANAIIEAIRESNLDELRKLLAGMSERERCWADAQGRTLLHHAVLEGHAECIAMLDVHTVRAHVADAFSMTPLMLAVARREDECASMLRAQRAPLISALNEDGFPLHASILRRDTAAVRAALHKGIVFAEQDAHGNPPLHCAVASGDPELVQMLLDGGANVALRNLAGNTPLESAFALDFQNVAGVIKASGAQVSVGVGKHW